MEHLERDRTKPMMRWGLLLILVLVLASEAGASLPAAIDQAARVRDYHRVYQLLGPLAKAGDAEAQYRLAGLYRAGRGVSRNPMLAAEWLKRAANQGYARAQHGLGSMYLNGWGVAVDLARARYWFEAAAAQGIPFDPTKLKSEAFLPGVEQGDTAAGQQALLQAALHGDRKLLQRLLDAGVAPDAADMQGQTALHIAAQ